MNGGIDCQPISSFASWVHTYDWAILILMGPVIFHYQIVYLCILFLTSNMNEMYSLVLHFDNRWRWCCGCFNFRQRILELDYQRSLCQDFCHCRGVDFFQHFRLIKIKYLLCFYGLMGLVSRLLFRRFVI